MTIPEKIVAFLRVKPGSFCGDCIKDGLKLARRQEVATVTLTLSLCGGFERVAGKCASRGHRGMQEKLVVRAL